MDPAHTPGTANHEKLEGLAAYEAAVDALIQSAQRNLRIFDRCLSREYNSLRRSELLRSFLLASRVNRLQIVVHDAANLQRDCPRLLNMLRHFSHSIAIHRTQPRAQRVYDPFSVADDHSYLHRFHYDQPRAVLSSGDVTGAQELLARYDEIWEASTPAIGATTLGL
jgi:hypothetical protein